MRQTTFTPIAILALNVADDCRSSCIGECAGSCVEELAILEQYGLKGYPLIGVYKGQKEASYLVPLVNTATKEAVLKCAADHNQESVLFSGIDRAAILHFVKGGDEVNLGVLSQVSEQVAKAGDCYTYDPATDRYFATSKQL